MSQRERRGSPSLQFLYAFESLRFNQTVFLHSAGKSSYHLNMSSLSKGKTNNM
jgi:hypothetical protein